FDHFLEIPSGESKVHIEVLSVLWGNRLPIPDGSLPLSRQNKTTVSYRFAPDDTVTLLKRIQKFYMAQDIGARVAIHIFNRISFAIAKGVGAQIVSRLPSNLL
ncbi:hypothetical protein Tco_1451904, partial [Tanacetum coccineum]